MISANYSITLNLTGAGFKVACTTGTTYVSYPVSWTDDPGVAALDANKALIINAQASTTSDTNKLVQLASGAASLDSVNLQTTNVTLANITASRDLLIQVLATVDNTNG
jgi:hypothetical protein